jgi:hypothetical protein
MRSKRRHLPRVAQCSRLVGERDDHELNGALPGSCLENGSYVGPGQATETRADSRDAELGDLPTVGVHECAADGCIDRVQSR